MGRFRTVLMPWDKRSQPKYRQEKFKLRDVPLCTSQSALDEKIFDPDWQPRPTWDLKRGKDFLGNRSWIFTSKENPEDSFDEMQLRVYRWCSFTPVFGDRWYDLKYVRRKEDPPLGFLKDEGVLKAIIADQGPMFCYSQLGDLFETRLRETMLGRLQARISKRQF